MRPVWGRVIVKPDNIDETDPAYKKAKELGIEIVSNEVKREQRAQVEGTLIAVGGNAFDDWLGEKPKEGDRILFDRYAGFTKEHDGQEYRIINDTDVIAIM